MNLPQPPMSPHLMTNGELAEWWRQQYLHLLDYVNAPCIHCGEQDQKHYCYFHSPEKDTFSRTGMEPPSRPAQG